MILPFLNYGIGQSVSDRAREQTWMIISSKSIRSREPPGQLRE
jgi:hypothetical protein